MATRQKHRMAGKPYNLHRKVEIPVELQVQDDGAFLNDFSSQPTPGQSGSKSDTDIESDIDSDIDALVNGSSDSDHDSVTSKYRLLGNLKEHHMLNGCRIWQVRIKLWSMQKFCLSLTQLVSVWMSLKVNCPLFGNNPLLGVCTDSNSSSYINTFMVICWGRLLLRNMCGSSLLTFYEFYFIIL